MLKSYFTHFENEDVGGETMVIMIQKVKTVLSMYQKHKVSVGSLTGQVNINKIIEGDLVFLWTGMI